MSEEFSWFGLSKQVMESRQLVWNDRLPAENEARNIFLSSQISSDYSRGLGSPGSGNVILPAPTDLMAGEWLSILGKSGKGLR